MGFWNSVLLVNCEKGFFIPLVLKAFVLNLFKMVMSMLTRSLESTQFSRSPNRRKQISLVGREESRKERLREKEKAGQKKKKLLGQQQRMCSVHLRKHSSYLKTMDYESTLVIQIHTDLVEPLFLSPFMHPFQRGRRPALNPYLSLADFQIHTNQENNLNFAPFFFVLICQSLLPKLAPFCKQTY